MIKASGNGNSQVFLITDGGSTDDVNSGYAISGASEITLKQIMSKEISFGDCWKTTLIKEKINMTDLESYKDKKEFEGNTLEFYKQVLINEIKELQPLLLIPLNDLVFRFLVGADGQAGIRQFRGSVMQTDASWIGTYGIEKRIKVLPILGPNPYINQEPKQRWVSQIDFSKVHRFVNADAPPEQDLKVWIAKNAESLRNFLRRSFDESGLLVFDIETFSGIPTCISFCFDGIESVCIPFLDQTIDVDNRALMLQLVRKVLHSNIKKVNQNIKYDWRCLERIGFEVNNVVGDTMLAASCLTPELPKNLGFLNSIYTDIPYFKDEGREFDPSKHNRDRYYLYNAKDSLSVHQIYNKQLVELEEVGATYVNQQLSKLIPIYKTMENNGIRYDDQRRCELKAQYTNLIEIQQLKLNSLTDGKWNAQSPKQMDQLIYNELGFTKTHRAKDTGEQSLENLMVFGHAKRAPITGVPILQCIIAIRKIHKVLEYLETIPYPDGKWRCEYNLAGAETGRSTAGKTTDRMYVWDTSKKTIDKIVEERLGRSFQTIGKHGFKIGNDTFGQDLRSIFVPSPGYCFVEVDLSQAEARVDAVLSGNFDILSVFDGPIGIHKLTGSWIFNCPPSEIKKNVIVTDEKTGIAVDRYHAAKTVRHAAERNMKAELLVLLLQQPKHLCEQVLKNIHAKQPEIRERFHRDIIDCVTATRALSAPNGRYRQFLGRMDAGLHNEAISQLPQAIVSDQLKFSLIPTMEECGSFARLLNEQHDGALAEVKIGKKEEYIRSFQRNVETGIDFRKNCSLHRDYVLRIPSEASVGMDNWQMMEDIKL